MFVPCLLTDFLLHHAARYPDKIALIHQQHRLTYQDVLRGSLNLMNHLYHQGLRSGDRMVICLENGIEAALLFWAALQAGVIVSLLHPTTATHRLDFVLQDSGARCLCLRDMHGVVQCCFYTEANANNVSLLETRCPGLSGGWSMHYPFIYFHETNADAVLRRKAVLDMDLAAIIYTSGSTGVPRGVMLTQRNMLAAATAIVSYLGLHAEDRIISALPLAFDYGLYQLILPFFVGATIILEKDFVWPYQFLQCMRREQASVLPGVPTLFAILANHIYQTGMVQECIRMVTNTGAALLPQHIKTLRALFPNAEIFSMYGLTECKRCTYLPPHDIDRKPGSVGIAIPNIEIAVIDEESRPLPAGKKGQLVVRGATVMQGYWNNPIATAAVLRSGKWPHEKILYTGDYGYLDEEGYFYFCGRQDETIKRMGEKVSLSQIATTIASFAYVNDIAVIDVPDAVRGSHVVVFIVTKSMQITEKILLKQCHATLPRTHWPDAIYFLSCLPQTANGKHDKVALQKIHEQAIVAMAPSP